VSIYDAPNQQVVRADGSAPWEEGTGGVAGAEAAPELEEAELDSMTKAQLLEYAQSLEVSPANNDMTKDELRAGIDEKLAGG
jgi:hypothetical protein